MSTRIAPEIKTEIYLPKFQKQCAFMADQLAEILAPDFYALIFKQSILDSEDPIAQALATPPELSGVMLPSINIANDRISMSFNVYGKIYCYSLFISLILI